MTLLWSIIVAGCLWVFSIPTQAADPIVQLPAEIKTTLDAEYPGWNYAPVNAQIQKEFLQHQIGHPPSLVWGDFDRDGRRDYAVQIAITEPGKEEQFISVFLQKGNSFEETVLESRGLDPSIYLWVRKTTMQDLLVVMGGPTGDTTYDYEGGNFHELQER